MGCKVEVTGIGGWPDLVSAASVDIADIGVKGTDLLMMHPCIMIGVEELGTPQPACLTWFQQT